MRSSIVSEITKFPKPGGGVSQAKVDGLTKGFKALVDRYLSEENAPLIGGRIIIIGSAAVGKSCLMERYFHGEFSENYKVTIGVDFGQKSLDIYGIKFKIQVFDTAGEEKFRSLSEQYYRNADCVLVCFDLGDMETLAQSRRWAREAKQYCRNDNLKVFLVGCKSDRLKVCESDDIEQVWEHIQAEYWETSALADKNVDAVFDRAAYLVFERLLKKFYKRKKRNGGGGSGGSGSRGASKKGGGGRRKKGGGGGRKGGGGRGGDGFRLKESSGRSNNNDGGVCAKCL